MLKTLFFLSLTIGSSFLYSSQPDNAIYQQHRNNIRRNRFLQNKQKSSYVIEYTNKDHSNEKVVFPYNYYDVLPPETQNIILYFATHNPPTETIKDASKIIRPLLLVDTKFNAIIDQPQFSDNLIKNLSSKYHCSHETVARLLQTKQSKLRLNMQLQLKDLCCIPKGNPLSPTLNQLIADNVDLEFTYNHEHQQKTPLMMAMSFDNNMFDHLLEQGVNINGYNSSGITALHLAVNHPINEVYCTQLITHPAININQQNKRGETALLYFLNHIKRPIKPHAIAILKNFLDAGADATIANKYGLTPLSAAEKLAKKSKGKEKERKKRISKLIKKAIKDQ